MSRRYLITVGLERKIAAWIDVKRSWTSEDYGKVYDAFGARFAKGRDNFVQIWSLWDDQSLNGVFWHEELAGPGGSSFLVFALPGCTPDHVKACVKYLRRQRDVVCLRIARVKSLVEFNPEDALK